MAISQAIQNLIPPSAPRAAKRLRAVPPPDPPGAGDPLAELRRIVHEHRALKRLAVRFEQSVSDITIRETGEVIKTRVSPATALDVHAVVKSINAQAAVLVRAMTKLLRGVPIYDEFLSKVDRIGGPVTSAYLVAMVKIKRVSTVSQLIRYCGFATGADGKSERRSSGPKYAPDGSRTDAGGTYNAELKIALVVAFMMARQGTGKKKKSKYLRRWDEAKQSALTLPNARLERVMKPGEADDKGRRKATDLFLWDLYVMWRTLEGLSIRPDKYSAVRGHYHNGQEARDAEYLLTLDEARTMVFGDRRAAKV
jgi:hypothetical protein